MKVYYCGHEKCNPGHSFGPGTRMHYLMHFVLKGKGMYQANGKTFHLDEGCAFLIVPREKIYYRADEKDPWEYVWIACDGPEVENLFESHGLLHGSYICKWDNPELVEDYLFKLIHSYVDGGYSGEELIGWLFLIFSKMQKIHIKEHPSHLDYYRKAELYLQNNYMYNIKIADVANHVGIDRTYLFKLFKQYAKLSPKQFLTDVRIKTAQHMLLNTDLSVTEIAHSCGFYDSSVFCKIFSCHVGTNALEYRKANKQAE